MYYVIKEVDGWDGQMMMFDDKSVAKCWHDQKTYKEKIFVSGAEKNVGIFLKKLFLQ